MTAPQKTSSQHFTSAPASAEHTAAARAPARVFGRALLLSALALAVAVAQGFACSDDESCEDPALCPSSTCIPSETPDAVSDVCGVFVSSSLGNDANIGTKGLPVKTLQAAVRLASTKRIYLCGEEIAGPAVVPAGMRIYGGLNCAERWEKKEESRATLSAGQDEIPLILIGEPDEDAGPSETDPIKDDDDQGSLAASGQYTVVLSDINITAKDALEDGGSSIGLLANRVRTELVRCRIEAGKGGHGKPGAPLLGTGLAGQPGQPGGLACSADVVLGGDTVTTECGEGDLSSTGGPGGPGSLTGLTGGGGQPGMEPNGGAGDTGSGCVDGAPGLPGLPGDGGAGGVGQGQIGTDTFRGNPGYAGAPGGEGKRGKPGQGGGGGGGAQGGNGDGKCPDTLLNGGASGGSGGTGGCGGAGGKGGDPGGSSIAVVSLGSTLVFTDVELIAREGGNGGDGGDGQKGGPGALGGLGGAVPVDLMNLTSACAGGMGGNGGDGGRGGGGQGGHSIGVAFRGKAPPANGVTIKTSAPGAGGKGGGAEGDGVSGKSPRTLNFPAIP